MKQLKQKGMAVIEYAVIMSFVTALGFALLHTTSLGAGVQSSVHNVSLLLTNKMEEWAAIDQMDPNVIPAKEDSGRYAVWLFTEIANRMLQGKDAEQVFEINGTRVRAGYVYNNTGMVAGDVPDGTIKSIKLGEGELYLYDNKGNLLNDGYTAVVGKEEPKEIEGEYIYKYTLPYNDEEKLGISYELNLTRGVVTVTQNIDGSNVDTIVKLSGYDFEDKNSYDKDSVIVSYSNYQVYNPSLNKSVDNKLISGLVYTSPEGDVVTYLGTNRDQSEGEWRAD